MYPAPQKVLFNGLIYHEHLVSYCAVIMCWKRGRPLLGGVPGCDDSGARLLTNPAGDCRQSISVNNTCAPPIPILACFGSHCQLQRVIAGTPEGLSLQGTPAKASGKCSTYLQPCKCCMNLVSLRALEWEMYRTDRKMMRQAAPSTRPTTSRAATMLWMQLPSMDRTLPSTSLQAGALQHIPLSFPFFEEARRSHRQLQPKCMLPPHHNPHL